MFKLSPIIFFLSSELEMLGLVGSRCVGVARKGVGISRWLSTSPYALSKIIYTECDEAPMLATYSLLPVIQRFAKPMGIEVNTICSKC